MFGMELFSGVFASLLAGFLTVLSGAVATWLASRAKKEQLAAEKQIATISQSISRNYVAVDAKIDALLSQEFKGEEFRSSDASAELRSALVALISSERQIPAVENLISGYHEQALNQARAQFWFSVAAATAGFVWILYSAVDIRPDNLAGIVKTLPGVVMNAVAFLFFKQASETRQRATDLYDRLRKDKQIAESITLVSAIEDVRVRSAVKAQMALHMAGLDPSPINLTNFLSTPIEAGQPADLAAKTNEAPPLPTS